MKVKVLLLAAAVLGVAGLTSTSTSAATGGSSLTTSPVAENITVQPGTSSTANLQLMDNGTQPLLITTRVETFSAYGNSGQAAITAPTASSQSTKWVTLSPSSFTAQPNVWTQVKMTINLPSSADLGYYYAILFQPQLPFSAQTPETNTVKGSNAVLVLVDTHSANEKRQLTVTNFSVSQKLYEYLPASFSVTVRNDGNIFMPPQGSIYISQNSNFSHPLAILDVNKAQGNVLPNSSRTFQATWSNGFPVFASKTVNGQVVYSKGKPVEQLQWNFTKFSDLRFGKYYAQLTLVYNNGTRDIPITGIVSFWVIPWKLLIGVPLGIIVLGFLVLRLGMWLGQRSLRRKLRTSVPRREN